MKPKFAVRLKDVFWALLLAALPFTSFPLLAQLMGGTSVAPLSAVFLLVLVLIFFLPDFLRKPTVPRQALPLLLFFLSALLSSALAVFIPFESFRGAAVWKNALEGILTILLGIAFYLVTVNIVTEERILKNTLKWIYLGGALTIIASLAQSGFWYALGEYPPFLKDLQAMISSSGLLYKARVTGVAFEPSWLANQLNTLYLPLWIGLSVKGYSIFRRKLFGLLSVENVLMGLGLLVLFLSFSRIGWLTTLAMAAFLVFRAANRMMNRYLDKRDLKTGAHTKGFRRFLAKLGLWLSLLVIFALIVLMLGVFLSRVDPRMEDLFDIDRYREFGILGWASQLSFAERLIYWLTAFKVFLSRPFFGVGLGGSGFFFTQLTPEFGYGLPEVIEYLFRDNVIPNAKNLWVRLLAETGIPGFSLFCAWLSTHLHAAQQLERAKKDPEASAFGLVGMLFLIAVVMEGFSMDSFGLPYLWIALALLISVFRIRAADADFEKNEQTAP
ncbi:MAG: O-antigen ligase family protein [Anaerolineaceae bacterium]